MPPAVAASGDSQMDHSLSGEWHNRRMPDADASSSDGPPAQEWTVDQLAHDHGLPVSTLRLYQNRGLLPPPVRRGRLGFYGPDHVARLELIGELQKRGFSLAGIKELLDGWQDGRSLNEVLGLATPAAVWEIEAPVVVSNLGPQATVSLAGREAFEQGYLAYLERRVHPTAILWLHFCSDERVLDYSAISVCGTRRVNMIDSPSLDCPDTAPPGKHLYTVGGAPPNALDPGDIDAEFERVMEDLREIIPGFDQRCRVLTRTCYRGKWPGFRTVPGSPVSHRTPLKGLFNVGDAACPRGFAGSMGAAKSALLVRDDLAGDR